MSAKLEVYFRLQLLETIKLVPEPYASQYRSVVTYFFLLNKILVYASK